MLPETLTPGDVHSNPVPNAQKGPEVTPRPFSSITAWRNGVYLFRLDARREEPPATVSRSATVVSHDLTLSVPETDWVEMKEPSERAPPLNAASKEAFAAEQNACIPRSPVSEKSLARLVL
jgi:hypothetical protein